jgi:hypothetical protein
MAGEPHTWEWRGATRVGTATEGALTTREREERWRIDDVAIRAHTQGLRHAGSRARSNILMYI